MVTSQPPPRASPAGATTTAWRNNAYACSCLQFLHCAIEHIPHTCCAATTTMNRFAPALKCSPSCNHESIEILFNAVKRLGLNRKDVIVKRVHLGMEFHKRHHHDIIQRRACVFRDDLLCTFQPAQCQHALARLIFTYFFFRTSYTPTLCALILIERFNTLFNMASTHLAGGSRGFMRLRASFTPSMSRFQTRPSCIKPATASSAGLTVSGNFGQ